MTGDVNEPLDTAFRKSYYAHLKDWPNIEEPKLDWFLRELAVQGLAVVEIGEPSALVASPCSESIGRGDVPTRKDGRADGSPVSNDLSKEVQSAPYIMEISQHAQTIDNPAEISLSRHLVDIDLREQVARIVDLHYDAPSPPNQPQWDEYRERATKSAFEKSDHILALVREAGLAQVPASLDQVTAELDAARATLAALTSDAAVEAAAKSVWPYIGCEPCHPARHSISWHGDSTSASSQEKDFAREAASAAIAAAIASAEKGT